MQKYNPQKIEEKWQEKWQEDKVHEPSLEQAENPFYNLMMFPYPSAEGLHVGNMYAFTGADIYGRFKRMQGHETFEPIGLDGFGIHSENYAMKTNQHPMELSKKSEENFYRQLQMLGNSFAWNEKLETYKPEYYKWTQWIFTKMFENGLAYRKKSPVNWCPSCKTVLADEQVVGGKCERCDSEVTQKDLEQWFFKITDYAQELLDDLEDIDWSEKVKIAQRNWIGKSEGAEIDFELKTDANFVLIHGFRSSPEKNFHPWLKEELESRGYDVQVPELPNPNEPDIEKQIEYVLDNVRLDEDTVLLGHSLGSVVALKALERSDQPIKKLVLAAGFMDPSFAKEKHREYIETFDWNFDTEKIKRLAKEIVILRDPEDTAVPPKEAGKLHRELGGALANIRARENHITAAEEPEVLTHTLDSVRVFTTRPDTLFGATYLVLGPEYKKIANLESRISNWSEVEAYIKKAGNKTQEERLANKEKTGVKIEGIAAINPANGKEIPVWVADYVLGNVGTGAIMAVPAHDERDFEFAKKFGLPIKKVVESREENNGNEAYIGSGTLMNSGKFNDMDSEEAKSAITEFVDGEKKVNYRLRDWLISRQRYWGPPIPMIFCEHCAERIKNQESRIKETLTKGELENPGWIAVPEEDLPVELPYVEDFRPKGTGESPLATKEDFFKVECPKCSKQARRETDVSDTFLDSAWYYFRYPEVDNTKEALGDIAQKWLPVDMYIGGAEHSVLHLLYTRFITKVFHDWGLVDFDEPFEKFRAHGLIIKDGAKMSKSKGNVINPDEYIEKFGADALRMYLMFLGPFDQGGDFRDSGILGIDRFLNRTWDTSMKVIDTEAETDKPFTDLEELETVLHKTIKKVTEDIESLKYNTAISQLMILLRELEAGSWTPREALEAFLKLLNPFAPHFCQELWSKLGYETYIDKAPWPEYRPELIVEDTFKLIVQINGKTRDTLEANKGLSEDEAKELAKSSENVSRHLEGKDIKKTVFVKDKLVNFVAN